MYISERPRQQVVPTTDVTPAKNRGRVAPTVLALGFVSLFTDISSESVSAILPLYLTAVLGLTPLAYGFIDGLYQGVSALVRIAGGYLADRLDRPKWVALFGYGLSAITKPLLLVFTGFGSLSTVITLDRLGKGVRTGPRDALIAAATPSERLGRAFGVHRALDTVGAAIGPLLAFTVLWQVPGSYSSVFVASFAAALIGLVVLVLLVPNLRPRQAAAERARRAHAEHSGAARDGGPIGSPAAERPRPQASLRQMKRWGMGRLMIAAAVLSTLAVSDGFLYLSLQQRDDLAATYFPLLFVGTNIAYFLLAVPLGRLSDRIGRQKVFVGGHLLLVAAYLAAAGPSFGAASTLLCLLFLGAFYAATDGVLAALTASLVPDAVRGMSIATTQTVVAVGRFAAAILFGMLWTVTGRGPAVLYFAVMLLVAIPLAWWMLSTVKPIQPSELSAAAAE